MKARIKFCKYGVMKFVGHLDIMRFFQKAMRRAGIPIAFTAGYSPHMIMSFAQPLGVGLTSEGEYMDVEFTASVDFLDAVRRLNAVMVEGMEIVSIVPIPEEKKYSGMTVVAAADYRVSPGDKERNFPQDFYCISESFRKLEQVVIWKQTKRSLQETDIRPMIYDFRLLDNGFFLRLAAGSVQNVKPQLVMQAFFESPLMKEYGNPKEAIKSWDFKYHRLELYARRDAEHDTFISLDQMGVVV